jgi:hypothetical protein
MVNPYYLLSLIMSFMYFKLCMNVKPSGKGPIKSLQIISNAFSFIIVSNFFQEDFLQYYTIYKFFLRLKRLSSTLFRRGFLNPMLKLSYLLLLVINSTTRHIKGLSPDVLYPNLSRKALINLLRPFHRTERGNKNRYVQWSEINLL